MKSEIEDASYDFEKMIDRLEKLERSCNQMKEGYDDSRDRMKEYRIDIRTLRDRVDDMKSGSFEGLRDKNFVSKSELMKTLEDEIEKQGVFKFGSWKFIEGNKSHDCYIKDTRGGGYYRIQSTSEKQKVGMCTQNEPE